MKISILMALVGASVSSVAWATDDCSSADAPAGFGSGVLCNPGSGSGGNIAQLSGSTWDCGTGRHGNSTGAIATEVANFNAAATKYSCWGYDAIGEQFCCVHSASNITEVDLHGADLDDDLSFFYDDGAGTSRNLHNALGTGNVTGIMVGMQGADTEYGSDDTSGSSLFTQTLMGNIGGDTILSKGGSGEDTLEGGNDDDTVCELSSQTASVLGGNGDDTLWGFNYASIDGGAAATFNVCGDSAGLNTFSFCAPLHRITTEPSACSTLDPY